jgi:hypothetical protein
MGTFSRDPFGNDAALDLLGDLQDGTPVANTLRSCFTTVERKGYLDIDDGAQAWAAAELVAAALGHPHASLPADALAVAHRLRTPTKLAAPAIQAVTLLHRAPPEDSELSGGWHEAGELDALREDFAGLLHRLHSPPVPIAPSARPKPRYIKGDLLQVPLPDGRLVYLRVLDVPEEQVALCTGVDSVPVDPKQVLSRPIRDRFTVSDLGTQPWPVVANRKLDASLKVPLATVRVSALPPYRLEVGADVTEVEFAQVRHLGLPLRWKLPQILAFLAMTPDVTQPLPREPVPTPEQLLQAFSTPRALHWADLRATSSPGPWANWHPSQTVDMDVPQNYQQRLAFSPDTLADVTLAWARGWVGGSREEVFGGIRVYADAALVALSRGVAPPELVPADVLAWLAAPAKAFGPSPARFFAKDLRDRVTILGACMDRLQSLLDPWCVLNLAWSAGTDGGEAFRSGVLAWLAACDQALAGPKT